MSDSLDSDDVVPSVLPEFDVVDPDSPSASDGVEAVLDDADDVPVEVECAEPIENAWRPRPARTTALSTVVAVPTATF